MTWITQATVRFQGTKLCLSNPLFHCFGCIAGTTAIMVAGGSVHIPGTTFSAQKSVETVEAERSNTMYGTPLMFVDVLNYANDNRRDISTLKKGEFCCLLVCLCV